MQKLFIAGCGYTGTLVAQQALELGWNVAVHLRDEEKATALAKAGAETCLCSMDDLEEIPFLPAPGHGWRYAMSSLRFDQVCFSYGNAPCVVQFSCNLAKGELVGLIGANGSGKSTLLRLGAGLLTPTVGQVELDGKPVRSWKGEERATRLGYLPQSIEAPLPFRVGELVELSLIHI